MAINAPLLRKVLEHITLHPDEWDQNSYAVKTYSPTACGTAYCVAGHAVVMTGHTLEFGNYRTAYYCGIDDGYETIAIVARKELGLSDAEAIILFNGENTLDRLWRLAEQFTDGEVTRNG